MKIKTQDLIGIALDYAVSLARGFAPKRDTLCGGEVFSGWWETAVYLDTNPNEYRRIPGYSMSHAWGGPIAEEAGIATRLSKGVWYAITSEDLGDGERAQWCEHTWRNLPRGAATSRRQRFKGPHQLVAAMRCYVASKLGDAVEIPDDLCSPA